MTTAAAMTDGFHRVAPSERLRKAGSPPFAHAPTPDAVAEEQPALKRLREITLKNVRLRRLIAAVPKSVPVKIPYTVALSPRQSRFAEGEARRLSISVAEVIRQLIDREIARLERLNPVKVAISA